MAACQTATTEEKPESTVQAEASNYYQEEHRPQYHFTPEKMWMNDPNGMVYYNGEYHLFYQHYPNDNVWGPMHWGHAISQDLVHWEHLPIALYPDSLGLIFSGSAVMDWNNTSGLGQGDQPPMIAIFTHHDMAGEKAGESDFQYQSIAYSNDKGRTWTKYEGNPVLPNTQKIKDFRDPKVFWHQATEQWVMIFAALDRVKLYTSPNLINWTFASDFGMGLGSQARPWECPDLFELKTSDGTKKWVMLVSIGNRLDIQGPNGGSATQYFVGDFDGKQFTLDPQFAQDVQGGKPMWIDFGRDNYAGVTWSDVPESDGRKLFIGWMSNWAYATVVPTTVWRSAMTVPRTLDLDKTDKGYRLKTQPIKELEKLRGKKIEVKDFATATAALADFHAELSEVILTFERTAEKEIAVELTNDQGDIYRIGYDGKQNQFFSDRTKSGKIDFSNTFAPTIHTAPRLSNDKTVKIHLFFDRSSVELFADDGSVVMTDIFFPRAVFHKIRFYGDDKHTKLNAASVYALSSAW